MKNQKRNFNAEFDPETISSFNNLPEYNPHMGNESGINCCSVEIKSHSFSVRSPHFLAGENIIFEPGEYPGERR